MFYNCNYIHTKQNTIIKVVCLRNIAYQNMIQILLSKIAQLKNCHWTTKIYPIHEIIKTHYYDGQHLSINKFLRRECDMEHCSIKQGQNA